MLPPLIRPVKVNSALEITRTCTNYIITRGLISTLYHMVNKFHCIDEEELLFNSIISFCWNMYALNNPITLLLFSYVKLIHPLKCTKAAKKREMRRNLPEKVFSVPLHAHTCRPENSGLAPPARRPAPALKLYNINSANKVLCICLAGIAVILPKGRRHGKPP